MIRLVKALVRVSCEDCRTRTLIHTAVGLIIPTLMFLVTVLGEVYAERFLDAPPLDTSRRQP